MAKSGKDERSWEDRVAAMHGTAADAHVDFDHDAADDAATAEEKLADEILLALKPCGMTAIMAMRTSTFLLGNTAPKIIPFSGNEKTSSGAMDSLLRADMQKYLLEILCRILEAPKPRLSVGCLLLAIGAAHNELKSQRQWADAQKVSIEHVNNEVISWQTLLNLPATSAQRSESAKESYRLANQLRNAA